MKLTEIDSSYIPVKVEDDCADISSFAKIDFQQKLYGIVTGHLLLLTVITSTVHFTPVARFYISENEWILHLLFILIILSYIVLVLERNVNYINIFLLFIHLVLGISVVAVFVAFYNLLGVLQGIFLSTCQMTLLFMFSILCRKTSGVYMALFASLLLSVCGILSFQMMFGTTLEELITSVILYLSLSLYFLYSVNLATSCSSYKKLSIAVINIYIWPFITLFSKFESLMSR